jgi:2-dehydro-3-deoxyphosphooctonate aldolase (KDO 8-P synthase)
MLTRDFRIGDVAVGGEAPLFLIGGPCVIEDAGLCREVATEAIRVTRRLGLGYIFKSSFDKANRSSGASFRGIGFEEGLDVLAGIRESHGVPVLTDIHETNQAPVAAGRVDVLQIPAFLCRQTDLLRAAAATGAAVNVKKGQFLSPWDMPQVVAKLTEAGCQRMLLTERGASFGYSNLVTDLRSLPVLRQTGWPVVFDGTHSAQLPGSAGTETGGMREMIPYLVRGAVAAGVDGVFLEVHPDPPRARSDAATQLYLGDLEAVLTQVQALDAALRQTTGEKRGG